MRLISYAQNAEDVLLWRALRAVPDGFYIDVGANDPKEGSVTKLFYDAGWRGINIEPMPSYRDVLQRDRPRDINLALACGAAEGSITLFDTPDINGWASTDADTARAHRADGVNVVEIAVPMRTLTSICDEYAPAAIHFLKIDVEGFESEVLRGMDLRRWRPWILVIEATLPNSTETNHERWEHLVTPNGYQFAFFDGLNRYYVADEHAHLLPVLAVPPNVFDQYISRGLAEAWRAIEELQGHLAHAETAAAATLQQHQQAAAAALQEHVQAAAATLELQKQAEAAALKLQKQAAAAMLEQHKQAAANTLVEQVRAATATLQAQLDALEINRQETVVWALGMETSLKEVAASLSWRVTRPLRYVQRITPRLGRPAELLPRLRRLGKRALIALAQVTPVRHVAFAVLRRVPGLEKRFLAWYAKVRGNSFDVVTPGVPPEWSHLPQSARRVLADLERPQPLSDR